MEAAVTRINLVPPRELGVRHLVAEYRELPRVFSLVARAVRDGRKPADIIAPADYVLGKGHVKFFYTRLAWLADRQFELVEEMKRRGYTPQFTEHMRVSWANIPDEWWGDYQPTRKAIAINRQRIKERSR
jgi:deoxyribonuclease (pyrimidine dimer)